MSVVLVCLPGAPKVSEEAVKKEEELDKYLETRVEGQCQGWEGFFIFFFIFGIIDSWVFILFLFFFSP